MRRYLLEQGLLEAAAQHWDEEAEAEPSRQGRATDTQHAHGQVHIHEAGIELDEDRTGNDIEVGHDYIAPVRYREQTLLPQMQNWAAEK